MKQITQRPKNYHFWGSIGCNLFQGTEPELETNFEEYTDKFNGEQLFFYMYRRFGIPLCRYDDYKLIGIWIMTTKMPGLVLVVNPRPGSGFNFGFGLSPRLYYRLMRTLYKWGEELQRQQREYVQTKYQEPLITAPFKYDWDSNLDIIHTLSENWFVNKYGRASAKQDVTEDAWKMFYRDRHKQEEEYLTGFEMVGNEYRWNTGLVKKIAKYLLSAIKELERPTNIRDQYFNALGDVPDKDLPHTCADYYDCNDDLKFLNQFPEAR